jgi:hypothetical protein
MDDAGRRISVPAQVLNKWEQHREGQGNSEQVIKATLATFPHAAGLECTNAR